MANLTGAMLPNTLAVICIFGAVYGYLTADPQVLFIFVGLGLIFSASAYYSRMKERRRDPDTVAIETLTRLNKK